MTYVYQDQLETPRLLTRRLTLGDAEVWEEFLNDKEATQYFPSYLLGHGRDGALMWIERQLKRYAEQRYGMQALIDKKTNNFIGQCGLLLQEVDGIKEVEIGYHILKKYWGLGYAPEAAKRFRDYAFENNLADSIISIIDVRNIKSQRVAEKNGMKRDKQTRWNETDVYIYRITKEENSKQ